MKRKRNIFSEMLFGAMYGLSQIFSTTRKIEPTPPDFARILPPNLNTDSAQSIGEILDIPSELAERIVSSRYHLDLSQLKLKFPDLDATIWEKIEGKVRF